MDGGLVADGEFVGSGGDGAVAFEAVDAAFDGVAGFVVFGVEGGWASTVAAASLPVSGLVGGDGDGGGDATAPEVGADRPGGVGLVGSDPVRAGSRVAGRAAWAAGGAGTDVVAGEEVIRKG